MIDHVSLGVADLKRSTAFYEPVLAALGQTCLEQGREACAFGKTYPEFWINVRPGMAAVTQDCGSHVCFRARDTESVDAFHAAALAHGGTDDGAPGLRPDYAPNYYAAFVRDPDGNRIEAVTFIKPKPVA